MNNEPGKITSGDSVSWTRVVADYKASDGWVLHYAMFNAAANYSFDGVASGDDHAINLVSADTAGWSAGRYDWTAYVTKGADRHVVTTGALIVTPDPTAGVNYDGRTHARKMLEALEAVIEKRATASDMDLVRGTFGGREVERDPAKLIEWRDKYKKDVESEEGEAALARGERVTGNKIKFRFV